MKLDLKDLCKRLALAGEEETVSTKEINKYLLEQVLLPMMRHETVLLRDVDFSRFEAEDISSLNEYYEALEVEGRGLTQFVGALASAEPAACKARRFC